MKANHDMAITREVGASREQVWAVLADEVPASGLLNHLPDRVILLGVAPRNRECLWRLGAMAERLQPDQVPGRGK